MTNKVDDFELLTEKYRPKSFSEFIGNDFIIEKVKKLCETPYKLPHFLFISRQPGTGKTTLAKLIASTIGADTIFLNASDERGIQTIRDKIKRFISSYSTKPGVPKLIILDEADSLTSDAMEALRTMMEQYHKNARFIFTANYETKIIPPIRSRCLLVNFSLPEKSKILERMRYICENENLKYTEQGLKNLVEKYYPDMRKMIIKIQELIISGKNLDEKTLFEYTDIYEKIYKSIFSNDFEQARKTWQEYNIDFFDLAKYFYNKILNDSLSLTTKQNLILILADTEMKANFGVDPEIAWAAGFIKMINVIKNNKVGSNE